LLTLEFEELRINEAYLKLLILELIQVFIKITKRKWGSAMPMAASKLL